MKGGDAHRFMSDIYNISSEKNDMLGYETCQL